MSKQEKRRLERLKKELDNQQKKLDKDKKAFAQTKKDHRESTQKLERQQKQLQQKIRKFQLSQSGSPMSPGSGRSKSSKSGGRNTAELNKTKGELKDTKDLLAKTKKEVRELRKSIDDKDALIASLTRQLKKAGRAKKEVGDDKIIRQLKREIANLKKRLKLALRDLDKQARYYQQQLKRFKQDQQKWINRQRDIHKKKGVVIKYCFIDDIRKIKVYRKGKNRIKVVTRDGGEVIIKDIQIVDASEVEEAADDMIDEVQQELDDEFKKKKKKKKKKGAKGEEEEEDDEEEEEEPQTLDDIKDDEPFEDHTDEIYGELMEELGHRTKDLHRVNDIYCNDEEDDAQDTQFKELWESVIGRHDKWTTKLTEELKYDLSDELPDLNKKWQDEIYKVKDSVIIIRRRARKRGKKEGLDDAAASGQYSGGGDEENKSQDEVRYLICAKDQMLTELNGRISDLSQLNSIYFHPENTVSILSKEQQVQELVNNVENRHEYMINELSELPPSDNAIDELLPENNHQWKSLIYETGNEMNQNDAEPLRLELELRTRELDTAVKVVNGDEKQETLNILVDDIEARTNKLKSKFEDKVRTDQETAVIHDQDEWLEIMKNLQRVNDDLANQLSDAKAEAEAARDTADKANSQEPAQDFGPTAKAQRMVIDGLLSEMDNRRQDLNNLSNLNKSGTGDGDVVAYAEKLREDASKRHKAQNDALAANVRTLAAAAKAGGGDGDKDIQDALRLIEEDNKKWENQLNKLVDDSKNVDDLKKRNKAAMDELNGRIADVLKMKNLYNSANDKADNNARQNAETEFDSLQQSIKDRHEGVEQNMATTIDTSNKEDQALVQEMEVNDADWRDAVFNTASHVTGLDEPEPEAEPEPVKEKAKPQYKEVKVEEVKEEPRVLKKVAVYDDEQKEWWLDRDAKRRNHIDTIVCDNDQNEDVIELAAYCDRVLYHPNTDDMGVVTDLYFPIPKMDQHHILSTFYDGTMLCDMINRIDADYVDKRVINYADPFDPQPLSDKLVIENVQLLLSAARSIGVEMTSYDVEDWMDATKHSAMLIDLVNGLSEKLLDAKFNLKTQPELCRLIKNGEDPQEVQNLTGKQWISRWMNQASGKGIVSEIDEASWNAATYDTMKKVSPIFNAAAPVGKYGDDPNKAATSMIGHVTNKNPRGTTVRGNDLTKANWGKIHKYFSAEAYDTKSGIAPLNPQETEKYAKYLNPVRKSDEDTYISWINAMLPAHLHVNALIRDLSDGVILLKLLEKGKQGCVNWKKAREKVRHKFDKLNNCNIVVKTGQNPPFSFHLVGMGGNDIVDGQQKLLSTLLWQLMRYNAVRQISELSFGGKAVSDQDILQWANITVDRFEDKKSKSITNFKDRQLTTCIFYLELLAAVRPREVDASLTNYEVRALVNNRVDDKFREERIANARLAMSYTRKFGAELFTLPEHLIGMDSKAVLSMFAAIMTVGMTDSSYSGAKGANNDYGV